MESGGYGNEDSMITKYHAKYYTNLLMQKTIGSELATISQSLLSSAVDINPHQIIERLSSNSEQHTRSTIGSVENRNLNFYKEEENRIYRWERDVIDSIEHELDVVKRNINETERLAHQAETLNARIALEHKAEELRRIKRRKRNELEDREDEISAQRKRLLAELEKRMIQTTSSDDIFFIAWSTL